MHNFPQFMFDSISEKEKILGFNQWIKQIEKEEHPDVIIIGVPGGIMPYSERFPEYFGITMYEVMQAVKPDILIMSCLYEEYLDKYFLNMAESIKYKFGVEVDCFNLSTFKVDINESEQNNALQYYKLNYEDVDSTKKGYQCNIPIYNIMNGTDGEKMSQYILDKLEEYSEAEFV